MGHTRTADVHQRHLLSSPLVHFRIPPIGVRLRVARVGRRRAGEGGRKTPAGSPPQSCCGHVLRRLDIRTGREQSEYHRWQQQPSLCPLSRSLSLYLCMILVV